STQAAANTPAVQPTTTQASALPASATMAAAAPADAPASDANAAPPGKLVVTAMGLVDPGDPRYAHDQALLQSDVKADSRAQLVAKALAAVLHRDSYIANYDLLPGE